MNCPTIPMEPWPEYLHRKLQSDWVLSPTCRENCECYFLRHWETHYFVDSINLATLTLEYHNNTYKIIPAEASGWDRYTQVALSFRKPKPELNLPAYVLVKGIEK